MLSNGKAFGRTMIFRFKKTPTPRVLFGTEERRTK